jgi:hypothetical protein
MHCWPSCPRAGTPFRAPHAMPGSQAEETANHSTKLSPREGHRHRLGVDGARRSSRPPQGSSVLTAATRPIGSVQ